jgi:DNA-binding winged helix-turn-helix (wHTH) protein
VSTTAFGPFCLDLDNQCVRREGREIALTPKAFAVLRCLLERRGRLVSKRELLDAVWPDTVVVDAVLKVVVLEIRKALGETGRSRGFIETLYRRGYRFRGEGAAAAVVPAEVAPGIGAPATSVQGPAAVPQPAAAPPRLLVGRQRELAELQRCRMVAAGGRRRLVFVVGEPGAGKSSLLELFLRDVAATPAASAPLVAMGQCNAMVGPGEPYMPVLEALARLCRGPSGPALLQMLARVAPTWLLQMPWLVPDAVRGELERELRLASRERMVRELIELVEALAAVTPLVLLIEDLHWSDDATLGLLAALAARTEPARCLVVATTRRPDDAGAAPGLATLLAELVTSGRATVLELPPLTRAEVAAMITARAPAAAREGDLAEAVHRRTGGRPLFVEHVLDDLLEAAAAGQPAPARVPPSLRSLLTAQLERLPSSARMLLEVAALCGTTFVVAGVAAALDLDPLAAEDLCLELARSTRVLGPLDPVEWPDGTVTARCRFTHELLRDVAAERVAPARARSLHQRLGERLEQAFASSLDDSATELAFHFAAARDLPRTVRYLRAAGRTASSRLAPATAVAHLQRALALVADTPLARDHALVAAMQQELGNALRDSGDMRAAQRHYAMMAESAVRASAADRQAEAWLSVASAASWIDRDAAAAATAKARALVGELSDPLVRAHVEGQLGYWHLLLEGFRPADEAASTAAIAALRAASRNALAAEHMARHSFFSCLRSRYGQALTDARAAKVTCRESGNCFDYLLCAFFGAWAALHGGQWGEMLAILHDADAVAERNGHDNLRTLFRLQRGWLHEHAFSLDSARALSESALAAARAAGHDYGEMVGEVLLGYAQLGAGDVGEARCRFQSVSGRLAERRVLMDWMWRMPIAHGLGECDLLGGDLTAARRRALGVLSLAGQLGDRHYLALGHRRLALVAEREGDLDGMEAALDEATRTLGGGEAPLAAFRVQATCARLWQQCGRQQQAESARQATRATLDSLAASLASAERVPATAAEATALRQALLASAEVP